MARRRDRFRPAGPPSPSGRPRRGGARRRVHGIWKHGPIPVIGLVGGIGAGKSAVAAALSRRGAFVLDADKVGHALLDQPPARDRVVRRFGPEILAAPEAPRGAGEGEGEDAPAAGGAGAPAPPPIDRKALGAIVFADGSARRDLEAILHPRMRATFERAIDRQVRRGGQKAIVLDAAVLYEAGWDELCDIVVFVDAPQGQREARVRGSRGWTAAELASREAAQMSLDKKRERADAVIENNSTPEALEERVAALWSRRLSPRSRYRLADD
jgi:dephospho-CoA kinase